MDPGGLGGYCPRGFFFACQFDNSYGPMRGSRGGGQGGLGPPPQNIAPQIVRRGPRGPWPPPGAKRALAPPLTKSWIRLWDLHLRGPYPPPLKNSSGGGGVLRTATDCPTPDRGPFCYEQIRRDDGPSLGPSL